MSLYDADRLLNLLAAVEGLPPAHRCPGLAQCLAHPRWSVVLRRDGWYPRGVWVFGPNSTSVDPFPTHAEAVAYATERARAEQLAAITHSEGIDALPTPDLETP